MTDRSIKTHADLEGIVEAALGITLDILAGGLSDRPVRVALSGGSTPRLLHEALAREPEIEWSNVHLYFGDERTVAHDHPDSNYLMAYETLIRDVDIPPSQVHRMRGEIDPAQAATEYEDILIRTFGLAPGAVPKFDLIMLGMGADGHTASLFPSTSALAEHERNCVSNEIHQLETTRLTLTFPVLNAAKTVMFMAAGQDKSAALKAVLEPDGVDVPPAGLIRPTDGCLYWLVDEAAASDLSGARG